MGYHTVKFGVDNAIYEVFINFVKEK